MIPFFKTHLIMLVRATSIPQYINITLQLSTNWQFGPTQILSHYALAVYTSMRTFSMIWSHHTRAPEVIWDRYSSQNLSSLLRHVYVLDCIQGYRIFWWLDWLNINIYLVASVPDIPVHVGVLCVLLNCMIKNP